MGLVAPFSSTTLDDLSVVGKSFEMEEIWRYDRHLNLDDLDFAEDGIWMTLKRVVGRRGLVVWKLRRQCSRASTAIMQGDW